MCIFFTGGPLEQGDIEDFDGELKIVCPWHSYDFDLKTGISSSGLHVTFCFVVLTSI